MLLLWIFLFSLPSYHPSQVPMLLFWIFLFSCTGCHWTIEEMHASSVGGIFVGSLFAAQAELNLYLLAFNLLVPCLPLDGATVIVCGLVGCGLRPLTAAKVVVAMSCVSLAMLATLVLTALFSRTLDPSLPVTSHSQSEYSHDPDPSPDPNPDPNPIPNPNPMQLLFTNPHPQPYP